MPSERNQESSKPRRGPRKGRKTPAKANRIDSQPGHGLRKVPLHPCHPAYAVIKDQIMAKVMKEVEKDMDRAVMEYDVYKDSNGRIVVPVPSNISLIALEGTEFFGEDFDNDGNNGDDASIESHDSYSSFRRSVHHKHVMHELTFRTKWLVEETSHLWQFLCKMKLAKRRVRVSLASVIRHVQRAHGLEDVVVAESTIRRRAFVEQDPLNYRWELGYQGPLGGWDFFHELLGTCLLRYPTEPLDPNCRCGECNKCVGQMFVRKSRTIYRTRAR